MGKEGLIQIGEIESVNYSAGTVKVLHSDAGINGSVSTDLPIMRPKRPEVGDQVACIYLSNGPAFGICLGAHYTDDDSPPESGQIIEIFSLPNGDSIQYDTATKQLILNAQSLTIQVNGDATIEAQGNANISGKNITIHADNTVGISGTKGVTIHGLPGNSSSW